MATVTGKARMKPADGNVGQNPATLSRNRPLQEECPAPKAADPSPASYGSLREYLKANR